MGSFLIATSWDDGHPLDARIADLLEKHGLPGCFYVPRENPEHPVMSTAALKALGKRFEIGGHSLSHLRLTSMSGAAAREEIAGCKRWQEDLLGRSVGAFCYPGGLFREEHERMVEECGFIAARTADWMCTALERDPFRIRPSLHFYPHGRATHLAHCLRRGQLEGLADWLRFARGASDLGTLARSLAKAAQRRNGVLHLWGHSWEIDQLGLWNQLEALFRELGLLCKNGTASAVENAGIAQAIRRRAADSRRD